MRLPGRAGGNSVPRVQNIVPALPAVEHLLADRAVARRREAYAGEVRRLIDAALSVMQATGDIDPAVRDIVAAAGLSNQAFYRHFASKDALLLVVLADGQRRLVEYLRARTASTTDPREQIRRWIDGVLAQARDPRAAVATRPFALNGARLADRFPDDLAAARAELLEALTPPVAALGGSARDAEFVRDLALERMNSAITQRRAPDDREVDDLVAFCLAGVGHGT